MTSWIHARKGKIEGKVISDDGVWMTIELANRVRIGHGDPMLGTGFRGVHAGEGTRIQVRKSLLEELPWPS